MYEGKFSKGAKLIREDGKEESLEGIAFIVRPLTNLVRIQAARCAKRMDSPDYIETARASIASVNGAKVTDWPDWSFANSKAASDVDRAFSIVNGYMNEDGTPAVGDSPLPTGNGGSEAT